MRCNFMMCNVKIFYLLCGKRLLSIHPGEFPPEKSTSKLLLGERRTLWGKHEQAACHHTMCEYKVECFIDNLWHQYDVMCNFRVLNVIYMSQIYGMESLIDTTQTQIK